VISRQFDLAGPSTFGHRATAKAQSAIKLTNGMNIKIAHHPLKPARCRIQIVGIISMMIAMIIIRCQMLKLSISSSLIGQQQVDEMIV
jgi:hypothetical protein